jgi:MYXO-CTERM domain-containing protein
LAFSCSAAFKPPHERPDPDMHRGEAVGVLLGYKSQALPEYSLLPRSPRLMQRRRALTKEMKTTNRIRLIAAVCLAIALSPVAARAQISPGTSPATTTSATTTDDRSEHHDYGWAGLLGLLGLAGLMRKRDDTRRDVRYDTTASRTDTGR